MTVNQLIRKSAAEKENPISVTPHLMRGPGVYLKKFTEIQPGSRVKPGMTD